MLSQSVIPAQAGILCKSARIIMGLAPPNVVSRLRGNDRLRQFEMHPYFYYVLPVTCQIKSRLFQCPANFNAFASYLGVKIWIFIKFYYFCSQ